MSYFTLQNLTALIPLTYLTEGLDDSGDGVQDAFTEVQTAAENRVNGLLRRRYTVPIPPGDVGVDAFLCDVSSLIAAGMVYTRRGIPADQWPFKGDHSAAMGQLRAISKGEEPLSPVVDRATDAAEIISEPSRSYSANLSA